MKISRKHLTAQGLLSVIHNQFKKITPPRELAPRAMPITLTDYLMSGLAMFGLKFPSLLKFDESREEENIKHNLRTLYHVQQTPCDTYMRGGRVNWRIENNTFNTLKNQDYHFSHNFGHGYKNLSTVFGMLMMLAFFVDQVQELSCHLFKKARANFKSRTSLWETIRSLFKQFFILSWDDLFRGIAHGYNKIVFMPNTS